MMLAGVLKMQIRECLFPKRNFICICTERCKRLWPSRVRPLRHRRFQRTFAAALLTSLLVAISNGDELLFLGPQLPVGESPVSVTTGDFNGDNVTDLAIANQVSDNVSVLLGLGGGTCTTRSFMSLEMLQLPS